MRLFHNATNGSSPFGYAGGTLSPLDKNHIPLGQARANLLKPNYEVIKRHEN